jgi:hypothetical protein
MKSDEPILGDGDFVEKMLRQAEEDLKRKYCLEADEYDFNRVAARAAHLMHLKCEDVLSLPGKYKKSYRFAASSVIELCVSRVSAKLFWRKNLKSVNLQ